MADTHDDKTPPYESLRVDRSGGVVTITLDRPAKKNAINGAMWNELGSVVAEIARQLGRPRRGDHRRGRRLLLRCRPVRAVRERRAPPGPDARRRRSVPRHRPAPAADDRQGPRRRRRRRAQPGAGVRPRGRGRGRPVLRDLRQARPQPRLRRVVDPPAARRHAPRQGAGAAGAHHRCRARRPRSGS